MKGAFKDLRHHQSLLTIVGSSREKYEERVTRLLQSINDPGILVDLAHVSGPSTGLTLARIPRTKEYSSLFTSSVMPISDIANASASAKYELSVVVFDPRSVNKIW